MDDLDRLLNAASAADAMTRIDYRDRIAAFGVAAINRLEPWLSDSRLGAFAVRTIERAAAVPGAAVAAGLVFERSHPNSPVRDDIEAAWARLGGRPRSATGSTTRTGSSPRSDTQLLRRFDADMLEVYQAAKREAGYRATRFLQKVRHDGGLETAHYLLRQSGVSTGFVGLWKAAKLDLSMEYLVLRREYPVLFSSEERAIARQRLLAHGFAPTRVPG